MAVRGLLSRLGGVDPTRGLDPVQSIIGNLSAILNARLGDALASPELGLVDFADVANDFPAGIAAFQRTVKATISQYEPRLKNVRVRVIESDNPLRLVMEVSARLADDPRKTLKVRTQVLPGGRVEID